MASSQSFDHRDPPTYPVSGVQERDLLLLQEFISNFYRITRALPSPFWGPALYVDHVNTWQGWNSGKSKACSRLHGFGLYCGTRVDV